MLIMCTEFQCNLLQPAEVVFSTKLLDTEPTVNHPLISLCILQTLFPDTYEHTTLALFVAVQTTCCPSDGSSCGHLAYSL